VIGSPHDQYERGADAQAAKLTAMAVTPATARANFSDVRIHTDSRAADSARAVGARAYTVGNHVVFGAGRYTPRTREGMLLLAHELTHVQQQAVGGSQVLQRQPDGTGKKEPDDKHYPPSSAEENPYSYEHFALEVTEGYKTPELGTRKPKAPEVKD
jgi:Domain of unknown function (DUF4157)